MAKTVDLNHLYDDEGLYSALVARDIDAIEEGIQLSSTIKLWFSGKTNGLDTLELFAGSRGSRYKDVLESSIGINVSTQVDLRKDCEAVTQGDVLNLNLGKRFPLIIDGWDNIELLPAHSEDKLAESISKHLTKDGVFIQRAWTGLGGFSSSGEEIYCRILPKDSELFKRFAPNDTVNLVLRVHLRIVSDLICSRVYYENVSVIDPITRVMYAKFDVCQPVTLTNSTAYTMSREMEKYGFKVETIYWDSEGYKATRIPTDTPLYHVYYKGEPCTYR